MKYISMKMLPKGRMPPSRMMVSGSMNHFFSGMGRGTAFTLRTVRLYFLPVFGSRGGNAIPLPEPGSVII
jgi:hypothetical protein